VQQVRLGNGQVAPHHRNVQIAFQGRRDGVLKRQQEFAVDNQILNPSRVVQARVGTVSMYMAYLNIHDASTK
jgi:hypothetical protein